MHHNVYAKNNERNPQLRADVRNFDYRNNVIYDWGYYDGWGYGIRIKNEPGEPKVNGNFINNYFVAGSVDKDQALVYGLVPGSDTHDRGPFGIVSQGTVVSTSQMGKLYVAGNVLPAENLDQYSTIAQPLPLPSSALVTTWSPFELGSRMVPTVGTGYRTATEQAILNELVARMSASQ